MRAVILAGGKGTRLVPYTTTIPKPLVPVGEMAIMEIVIRQLSRCGFDHITVAVNHQADAKAALQRVIKASVTNAVRQNAEARLKKADNPNLALVATVSNPEGYKQSHRGRGGPTIAVAMDGDRETRWIPEGGKPLYRVVVELDRPREVGSIRIYGYRGNRLSPKDFDILCDGKVVREVRDLESKEAQSGIDFPVTKCKTLQLNITDSYHGAPGIRELEVYGGEGN